MHEVIDYLRERGLASLLLLATVVLALILLSLHSRGRQPARGWIVTAALVGLLGLGGLLWPMIELSIWLVAGGGTMLFVLLLIVVISSRWSAILGWVSAALILLGTGGLLLHPLSEELDELWRFLLSMRVLHGWWLVLLLVLPVLVALSFRSLAGLGPIRRWLAIGLRCAGITFLILAVAELQARSQSDHLTVFFLWDRSLSIPQDIEDGKDLREERILRFINQAIARRGPGRERDQAGVIVFGKFPRLEVPPTRVPELKLTRIVSQVDDSYTDIAAAIKLALASFPEGTGKRIVLISDGNENLGHALEQARLCKQHGVQIDVVPVTSLRQRSNEVLIARVEAPSLTEKEARLPLRIVIRSFHPEVVVGQLTLERIRMEMRKPEDGGPERAVFERQPVATTVVKLRQGLNTFFFQQPGARTEDSHTYEARFLPLHVENERGQVLRKGLPGDRWENNRASANVVARGQKAVLLLESSPGEHKLLASRLQAAKASLRVVTLQPDQLPEDPAQLALVLSKFDAVILANLPCESLSEKQQMVIRSNTHDQGCGLIMIGGPVSFGAGGWQGSEVEKALPVTCDLKSTKVQAKGGLVLIMHGSEMAEGNFWQKKIAKLAIERLSGIDMVGMLYYDWQTGADRWHIPFQVVGVNRDNILRMVDTMSPGDMPDAAPSLRMAKNALSNPAHQLGVRHIIFISDGDHWNPPVALLNSIKQAKITCATVCITTHGAAEVAKMKRVADLTGAKSYHVTNPKQLPAIYIKESRVVSQAFVHDATFQPRLLPGAGGPTEGLPKELDKLHGFVRTTKRPNPLVEVPIQTDKIGDQAWPVLAYWQYGLGRAVAFTSDARTKPGDDKRYWDHDWANSKMYSQFWEQVVEWALRSVESGRHLQMTTEYRDGKVKVIIEARDEENRPLTNVELEGGVTSPSLRPGDPRKPALRFEQRHAGIYEAEIRADEVGAYFIHVKAKWKDRKGRDMTDSIRGGATVPYSPEFAEMESNTALLEALRDMTGGKTYPDTAAGLEEAVRSGDVFRAVPLLNQNLQPVWHWLVLLAAACLLLDVAVRRVTFEPGKVATALAGVWARLRGEAQAPAVPEFMARLANRKAQVGEDLAKAARRFEGGEGPGEPLPTILDQSAAASSSKPRPVAPAPRLAPEGKEEPGDYMSRLKRARKKVREDLDRKKGE